MTIDAATGLVLWTPGAQQLGKAEVSLAAADPSGYAAIETYTITVRAANQKPGFTSSPVLTVTARNPYHYDVRASDPDGDPLTFRLAAAPDGMAIDRNGRITWTTAAADVGSHHVEVIVEDGRGGSAAQPFDVVVGSDDQAPRASVAVRPNPADVGTPVTIVVSGTDDVGVTSESLTAGGTPLALDATGRATFRPDHVGTFEVVGSVFDAAGNVGKSTDTLVVRDPRDTTAPVVAITAPADRAIVTTFTDVIGTVTDDNLSFYTLAVAPVSGGDFTEIARGTTPVTKDKLGVFDPTLLENDSYILRLSATDAGGHTSTVEQTISAAGSMKLGNFRLAFTDLSESVSGIPITVGRTYDTLRAQQSEDFGYGWRLEYGDTDLRTSVPKTGLESEGLYSPFREGTRVYVTLPGGTREGFTFRPVDHGFSIYSVHLDLYQPKFEPDPGVTDELTVDTYDLERREEEYYGYGIGGIPYNPASDLFGGDYTLTTKDDITYRIDARSGHLLTVADRNGNALQFTDAGIFSKSGPKITFARDPQGRIITATDPGGNVVSYRYTGQGDLSDVTDPDGNDTRFVYNPQRAHYLDHVIDELGRTGLRSEYDAQGRLIKLIDVNGESIQLVNDLANGLETVKDGVGQPTTFEYDTRGNVITEIRPDGGIIRRTFDDANNLKSETDPLGHIINFTYDGRHNLLSFTDPLGQVTRFTYDAGDRLLSRVDPMGHTVRYTYDERGNLTSETDATGAITRLGRDAQGNVISQEDALGKTTFTYSPTGQMTSFTDPEGVTTTLTSDAVGNLLSDTHDLKTLEGTVPVTWGYQYNHDGKLTGITGPDGSKVSIGVDPRGDYTGSTDALGNALTVDYSNGFPTAVRSPDGAVMRTVYDAADRVKMVILPGGQTIQRTTDPVGREATVTWPDGGTSTRVYDKAGNLTAATDPAGRTTRYTYDADNRLVGAEVPGGHKSVYTYNLDGQVDSVTDPAGQITRVTHDGEGRVTGIAYPDGTTSTLSYDALGQVRSRVEPGGARWVYDYSPDGVLLSVTAPDGGVTRFGHDSDNMVNQVTDALGHATGFVFDTLGRLTKVVLPGGQTEIRTYDPAGRLATQTDFAGRTTTFGYDANGRLTQRTNFDGSVETMSYDANGALVGYTDARGVATIDRDPNGRPVKFTLPDGSSVTYAYGAAGDVTLVGTDAGATGSAYDVDGGLASVTGPNGDAITFARDAAGRPAHSVLPNGATIDRTYDVMGRAAGITYRTLSGQVLYEISYTRDATGRITREVDSAGWVSAFAYDSMGRLVSETITEPGAPARIVTYAYDAKGNLTRRDDGSSGGPVSISYDADDRPTSDGRWAYAWDADGNLTSRTDGTTTEAYTYDAHDRLVQSRRTGPDPVTISYEYDFDGLLASRTVDGVTTRFVWDRSATPLPQLLEERGPGGQALVRFAYGDAGLVSVRNADGTTSYTVTDHQGTTRAVLNADGSLARAPHYDAYGRPLAGAGPADLGFIGGYTDPGTGLVFLRNRWYAPGQARFIQPDPVDGNPARPDTLNL
jgi:RHS repeat-associated protein